MKPRVTVNLSSDGQFEIWMNREGRDRFVEELGMLHEGNDHFHLSSGDSGDIELSTVAYGPTDRVLGDGKVLFRTDEWDQLHYPHVMGKSK